MQETNGLQLEIKTSGRFFHLVSLVSQIKSVKTDFGLFFLSMFICFCFLTSMKGVYEQGTPISTSVEDFAAWLRVAVLEYFIAFYPFSVNVIVI